jgi:hypothetical protein
MAGNELLAPQENDQPCRRLLGSNRGAQMAASVRPFNRCVLRSALAAQAGAIEPHFDRIETEQSLSGKLAKPINFAVVVSLYLLTTLSGSGKQAQSSGVARP